MSEEKELLNYIYQNSQMGVISLEKIIAISEDKKFNKLLKKQLSNYEYINSLITKIFMQNESLEKGLSNLVKIKTNLMINFQTITNKTTSHLAEMLIIGSTMGVINNIKNLNKYSQVQQDYIDILKQLLVTEETNIISLKDYL